MRFKDFIREAISLETIADNFDNETFEKDCAPYLEWMGTAAKSTFMYRGSFANLNLYGKNNFKPRTEPMDSSPRFHARANDIIQDSFGKPFRNGIFVTGDRGQAGDYGDLYIIVPIGKFEWLMNKHISDLHNSVLGMEAHGMPYSMAEDEMLVRLIRSKAWVHNEDLPGCVKFKNEIMLWCPDGYYAFDEDFLPRAME